MNKEIKLVKKFFLQRSLFGFKVLNSLHSMIVAYVFIFIEFFITPYFGFEGGEIKAGIFFLLLINTSIFILLINSLIRISNKSLFLLIFCFPLIIYSPQLLRKIVTSLYYLKQIYDI